jgi:hypothetical protein
VEAQFSAVIYKAFHIAVRTVYLLHVITIFLFPEECLLQGGDHRMSRLFCPPCVRPAVRAQSPRPASAHANHVSARTLSAPSRPRPGTRPVRAKLWLAPVPVPARARSCSGWRPDSHLRLRTATSAWNSKKSYCSKVKF